MPGEMIRGYLLTENTLVHDGDFATELLLSRTNDFSDIYGNLMTRSLGKNIAGPLLETSQKELEMITPELASQDRLKMLVESVSKKYDQYAFSEGYELVMNELRNVRIHYQMIYQMIYQSLIDEWLFQRHASLDDCQGGEGGR